MTDGYHYGYAGAGRTMTVHQRLATDCTYDFENFFHPYVTNLLGELNTKSVKGMLAPDFLHALHEAFFWNFYKPSVNPQGIVAGVVTHEKEIDLKFNGTYANYNWELLFHFPLTVAVHLSKNQRFAEAQRWFHLIFDPTSLDSTVPAPQRYWKFLGFWNQTALPQQLDVTLNLLSTPFDQLDAEQQAARASIIAGYHAILEHPFQPHAVARTRPVAYQYSVLMRYLDNLIAWADSLFAQDTIETINEATLLYAMASNLLGTKPDVVPQCGAPRPRTYRELRAAGLDMMGNAMVSIEGQFPLNYGAPAPTTGGASGAGALFGIGQSLYFAIPGNDKLLSYWDTVGDRLFKIHHCMNIKGVVRQLALFDPPIDPGMLVKAAATGMDIGSVVSGVNQPISPVRSTLLMQKALEITSEVRGLGAGLLSALEKGDAEHLGRLRQTHEIKIQQLTQETRFLQWKGAEAATDGLLATRASALERYRYYQGILGLPDGAATPDILPIDRRRLTEDNFDDAYAALVAQYETPRPATPYPSLRLAGSNVPNITAGAFGDGQLNLTVAESLELNVLLPAATVAHLAASAVDAVGGVLTFIPDFEVDLHYWGLGASTVVFGGQKLSQAARITADVVRAAGTLAQDSAGMASKVGSYERRSADWALQSNLAARELAQVGRQILTSLIGEQVAHQEYLNIQKQIENSQTVDEFLHDKFTNEELYLWMQGETSRLFFEYYRFALETARRAERTMKRELMRPEVDANTFVDTTHWAAGRQGLLSGESLYLDIKRMELAYHDNNTREYELTKHVSLRQLDPIALIQLKTTGACEVEIPEWLFDKECAGQHMRRIKAVGFSLPSVVGPYTSVNCKLTLLNSTVRTSSTLRNGRYARGADDPRFVDYTGATESVVTSTAINDSGMFEPNLRDERFLPFEGRGAVGRWRYQLPSAFPAFDYSTISDAILTLRYTAREGGDVLGTQATNAVRSAFSSASSNALALVFNLRFEFPTEWSAFVNGTGNFAASLTRDQFPYMVSNATIAFQSAELYAQSGTTLTRRTIAPLPSAGPLAANNPVVLSIPADATVLQRGESRANIYLVVRYTAT